MGLRYGRDAQPRFAWWQFLLIILGVVLVFAAWQQLTTPMVNSPVLPGVTPTLPQHLTRADVFPTHSPAPDVPLRQIIFPGAHVVAPITLAVRSGNSWETRYLGDSVGHLEGTSWLDDPGGNIVLAGHVEDAKGQPGPFAHLFDVEYGDLIILREGQRQDAFRVASIERAAPNDMHYLVRDGRRRITLITCSDWDIQTAAYRSRFVVIAVPENRQTSAELASVARAR